MVAVQAGLVKPDVRFGSKADMCNATNDVRFTPNSDRESEIPQKAMSALPPESGHVQCTSLCLLWANSGHALSHSINWSARPISVLGTLRLSVLAVLRLITSSYLVGACTGRSAGFSPLRMRST